MSHNVQAYGGVVEEITDFLLTALQTAFDTSTFILKVLFYLTATQVSSRVQVSEGVNLGSNKSRRQRRDEIIDRTKAVRLFHGNSGIVILGINNDRGAAIIYSAGHFLCQAVAEFPSMNADYRNDERLSEQKIHRINNRRCFFDSMI